MEFEAGSCSAATTATATGGDEDSESECETEPAKSFHRRISTNKEIKTSVSLIPIEIRLFFRLQRPKNVFFPRTTTGITMK